MGMRYTQKPIRWATGRYSGLPHHIKSSGETALTIATWRNMTAQEVSELCDHMQVLHKDLVDRLNYSQSNFDANMDELIINTASLKADTEDCLRMLREDAARYQARLDAIPVKCSLWSELIH